MKKVSEYLKEDNELITEDLLQEFVLTPDELDSLGLELGPAYESWDLESDRLPMPDDEESDEIEELRF